MRITGNGRRPLRRRCASKRAMHRAGAGFRRGGCGRSRCATGGYRGGEARALVSHVRVQQADREIGILESPSGVGFVEPVDTQQIRAPRREIAGFDAFPPLRRGFAEIAVGQRHQRQPSIDVASRPCQPPARARPCVDGDFFAQHALRKWFAQQRAITGDEPAGLGEPPVLRDEIGRRHAIAIAENDVVRTRRGERAVADRRRAKAVVFVPYVFDGKARLRFECLDQFARRCGRAIIRDHQLEAGIALRLIAGQHCLQCIRPVVCRDDDGGFHCRFLPSKASFR